MRKKNDFTGRVSQFGVVLACGLLFARTGQAQQVDPGANGARASSFGDYGSYTTLVNVGGSFGNVEMLGRAYYPSSIGANEKLPLVFFLHGDHAPCYNTTTNAGTNTWSSSGSQPCAAGEAPVPNYLGYDYIGSHLASHGILAVSISANAINARDDISPDGTPERRRMLDEHLAYWVGANARANTAFGSRFVNHVDLTRVALVGHSMGGKAVITHAVETPPPGLRAVLGLAPARSGNAPLVNKPLAVLLGYCDRDVNDLDGVQQVDAARYVNPHDETPKYTFLMYGGNHNFFNRMWTPGQFPGATADDANRTGVSDVHCDPDSMSNRRVSADGQRTVAKGYMSAFLRKHLLGDLRFEAILKGDAALPQLPVFGTTFVGYIPAAPDRKDVNQVLDIGAISTNTLGGTVQCNGGACPSTLASVCTDANCRFGTRRRTHFGNLNGIKLTWTAPNVLTHNIPSFDRNFSNFRTLQLRVSQGPRSPAPTSQDPTDFSIRLKLGNGTTTAPVRAQTYSDELYYPFGGETMKAMVMNTLRVPLSAFTGVNLTSVSAIEIVTDRPNAPVGNLVIADMALVDPIVYGYAANYSDALTYGVQTGAAHKACTWSTSGQICTMPSTETIHWCYDPSFTAAAGRGWLEHDVPVFAAPAGEARPIVSFADLGFKMVKHDSCDDPEVQLVIDGQPCGATNSSSISGYVCTTFPSFSTARELALVNKTPWTAAGSYYSWGLDGGWTVLHIDVADIANQANPVNLIQHAAYHGLGWIIGLGARSDKDFLYTSTMVNSLKSGWTEAEMCRARSFRFAPDRNRFQLGSYCGWDSP